MTEVAQQSSKKSKIAVEAKEEHKVEVKDEGSEAIDLRAGAQAAPASKKIRLTLIEDESSHLSQFQNALKDRGVKGVEISDIVADALSTIPKEWWDSKLEELTPFEYKLHAALENPDLRAKLMSLLDGKKA